MPNAKDINKSDYKNIMIYGPTGSGKTTLFQTMPGKKLAIITDPAGPGSIAGADMDYEHFPPDSSFQLVRTMKGKTDRRARKVTEPESAANLIEFLNDLSEKEFGGYDVIMLDSLTTLQRIIMERVLYINGRYGQVPELSDYNVVGETIINITAALCGCPASVYITAHSILKQDEVSKKIHNQLDTIANIKRLLPRNMSDLWVSYAEQDKDASRFKIQTRPTREFPNCKNSFDLSQVEDITIDFSKPLEKQGVGRFWK